MRLFSALLLSILLVAGCSRSAEQQGEVSGKVTFNGKPLPGGRVTFVGAKGYTGSGIISPQGEYSLNSPLGEVRISVDNQMLKEDPKMKSPKAQAYLKKYRIQRPGVTFQSKPDVNGTYVRIPVRYADAGSSGLNFTVTPGSQTHDIELTDDPSTEPGS
jgi:hypothetical protein